MRIRASVIAATLFALACVLSACSGTTNTPPTPASPRPATQTVHVDLIIPVPSNSSGSKKPRRHPDFVSPSTMGAVLTVISPTGSHTANVVDLSSTSAACTSATGQRTCDISVSASTGANQFSIITYDAAPQSGAIPASAHVLATGSASQTITASFSGTVSIFLDAVVNGIGSIPAFSSLPADGSTHVFAFALNPTDFDDNAIVTGANDPFANPITVTLAESGGSGHAHLVFNGAANGSTATLSGSSDSVSVQYDGGGSPGYSIGVSFAAQGVSTFSTTVSPLYVTSASSSFSNYTLQLGGASSSIALGAHEANAPQSTQFTVNASACNGMAAVQTPVATSDGVSFSITGGVNSGTCNASVSDGVSSVSFAIVNTSASPAPTYTTVPLGPSLYVSNGGVGEMTTYPTTGWTPAPYPNPNNLTPTTDMFYADYRAGGLLCYDATKNVVWAISSIGIVNSYPANASGTNVPAVTGLQVSAANENATGCTVDHQGNVYVSAYGNFSSGGDAILIFPAGSTTAGTIIVGSNTGLNIPRKPAVDAAGNIYVPDSQGKDVRVFAAPGLNAGIVNVAPSRIIADPGFVQPWGVGLDSAGHVYVVDPQGVGGAVDVYAAGATSAANNNPLFVMAGGGQIPSTPNGLAIDTNDNLWVACVTQIQEFSASSLSTAFGTGFGPSPTAQIYGSNTKISGATGIEAH